MVTPSWLIAEPMLRVPAWTVIIMIIRDLAVDGIRMMAVAQGKVLAANPFGKVKTFFQMFAIMFFSPMMPCLLPSIYPLDFYH